MPDAEPTPLPIQCPVCGRAVTLTYEPTEGYRFERWTCPYHDCRAEHLLDLRGRIVGVVARYEP